MVDHKKGQRLGRVDIRVMHAHEQTNQYTAKADSRGKQGAEQGPATGGAQITAAENALEIDLA
ncbi:MAG: hypothetical protein Q8N53_20100 [Longimicrobiales bacterium]|nr:hypothetical protein [Longimicrobiales bacterium]